jgi:glycosyltransferase involved in cell wall biosynthesis
MRILHTIDSGGIYGAESLLLSLVTEQQRRGHAPIVLSIGVHGSGTKPIETELRRRGLACIAFRMRDGPNLAGALRILASARAEQVDLIHSHGYKTNILFAALSGLAHCPPVVTTLHGWTAKTRLSKLGIYRYVDQLLLGRHAAVVLVSSHMASIPAVRRLPKDRVHVVPNGIQITSTPPLGEDKLVAEILAARSSGRLVVGAIGRLSPEKDFASLIEAIASLRNEAHDVHAIVLGEGPERDRLLDLIEAKNVRHKVILKGYVADAHLYACLFDLFVLSSVTEGLPLTLLEAMAAGTPVVATAVGGVPDVVQDAGILVPPGDVPALAAAIRDALVGLTEQRAKALAAKERIARDYGVATMADRYDAIYHTVLRRAPT